jgi:hypothetical protein
MARLLGRTPTKNTNDEVNHMTRLFEDDDATDTALAEIDKSVSNVGIKALPSSDRWKGSGLGAEWDERVGAGAAASSIVS